MLCFEDRSLGSFADVCVDSARNGVWDRFGVVEGVRPFSALLFAMLLLISFHRGGMIAPMLGGILLGVSRGAPVLVSIVVFIIGGCCTLLLSEEAGARGLAGAMAH